MSSSCGNPRKTQRPSQFQCRMPDEKRNNPTEIDFVCCECNRLRMATTSMLHITSPHPHLSTSRGCTKYICISFTGLESWYCTGSHSALSRSDETRTRTLLPATGLFRINFVCQAESSSSSSSSPSSAALYRCMGLSLPIDLKTNHCRARGTCIKMAT